MTNISDGHVPDEIYNQAHLLVFLLLGILKTQNSHGYHITEFIEKRLNKIINLKKTTAYSILDRMVDQGYLTMKTEYDGNRPPRKIYSISPSGDQLFIQLLLDNLRHVGQITLPQEISMMLMDYLSIDDAIHLLEEKQDELADQLKIYEEAPGHQFGQGVSLAISHRIAILQAKRSWLEKTIVQLRSRVGTN